MSFIYESKTYNSEKNGVIQCVRLFGKSYIIVDNIGQTTPYVTKMWKQALQRVPKDAKVKKILLLGLGAGGQIKIIRKKFPHSRATAIEWDPVMVDIAKKIKFLKPKYNINVIVADAEQALKATTDKFDLILGDIFTGSQPCPELYNSQFINSITERLKSNGYLILNTFKNPDLFKIFNQVLSQVNIWQFKFNSLALYRHRGNGTPGDPLPEGCFTYKQSRFYLNGECFNERNKHVVGENGCWGLRWRVGPIWIESYENDNEPKIQSFNKPRLIIWQPLSRLDKPVGWRRSPMQMNIRQTGFTPIINLETYWENWSEHSRRHRKKWLKQKQYVIEECKLEEFCFYYNKKSKLTFLKNVYIKLITKHKNANSNLIHLFAARDIKTKKIAAGLAVFDLPDTNQSDHMISFFDQKLKNTSIGVGLIDHWFKHAINNKINFLNFGAFWGPGEPKSWKGFSQFKSQFGIYLINRPNPLVRFVGKNKI